MKTTLYAVRRARGGPWDWSRDMSEQVGWETRTGMHTVSQGISLAVLVWLGFVAAVLGPMYAFQAFSLRFFFITAGSVLLSLLIMASILGAWK